DVADDRHQQAAVGVDRDADVDVLLQHDLVGAHVDRGVELREHTQRRGHDLEGNRGDGEVAAGRLHLRRELLAQLLEAGDVGEVALGDVRDGRPGGAEVLRGLAPHGAHRLALDLAEAGEVGQRLRARRPAARAGAEQTLGVLLDVLDRDASAGTAAVDLIDVDAELARHPAHRRRRRRRRHVARGRGRLGGRPRAAVDVDHLAIVLRTLACLIACLRSRLRVGVLRRGARANRLVLHARLVGTGRLVLRLHVGLHVGDFVAVSLVALARVAFGLVALGRRLGIARRRARLRLLRFRRFVALRRGRGFLDRLLLRLFSLRRLRFAFRFGGAAIVDRENRLADLDLVAFLDLDLLHLAGDRRGDLDGRLVGLELEHRLVFLDRVAGFDEDAKDVAGRNVLAQLRKREVSRHVYEVAGFTLSGLMLCALIASATTDASSLPSRASAPSVATIT